jgi:hypothetical protein
VSCVHGDDGNADRVGSFNGRSVRCIGEQASRKRNRADYVWKTTNVGTWRTMMFANPQFLGVLEEQCKRLEAWREKRNPGSVEGLRKVYARMSEAVQENKARAASN